MVTEESITETLPRYIASELVTHGCWRKIERDEPGEKDTLLTTIIQDRDRTQLNSGDLPMLLFRGAKRTNQNQTFCSSHVQTSAMCIYNKSVKTSTQDIRYESRVPREFKVRLSCRKAHLKCWKTYRHFLISWRLLWRKEKSHWVVNVNSNRNFMFWYF